MPDTCPAAAQQTGRTLTTLPAHTPASTAGKGYPACSTPACSAVRHPPGIACTTSQPPQGSTMPHTTPSPASDDTAASLTALLGEFGGLWQISKTPHGYTAKRRPPPAPPLAFTGRDRGRPAGTPAARVRNRPTHPH